VFGDDEFAKPYRAFQEAGDEVTAIGRRSQHGEDKRRQRGRFHRQFVDQASSGLISFLVMTSRTVVAIS